MYAAALSLLVIGLSGQSPTLTTYCGSLEPNSLLVVVTDATATVAAAGVFVRLLVPRYKSSTTMATRSFLRTISLALILAVTCCFAIRILLGSTT